MIFSKQTLPALSRNPFQTFIELENQVSQVFFGQQSNFLLMRHFQKEKRFEGVLKIIDILRKTQEGPLLTDLETFSKVSCLQPPSSFMTSFHTGRIACWSSNTRSSTNTWQGKDFLRGDGKVFRLFSWRCHLPPPFSFLSWWQTGEAPTDLFGLIMRFGQDVALLEEAIAKKSSPFFSRPPALFSILIIEMRNKPCAGWESWRQSRKARRKKRGGKKRYQKSSFVVLTVADTKATHLSFRFEIAECNVRLSKPYPIWRFFFFKPSASKPSFLLTLEMAEETLTLKGQKVAQDFHIQTHTHIYLTDLEAGGRRNSQPSGKPSPAKSAQGKRRPSDVFLRLQPSLFLTFFFKGTNNQCPIHRTHRLSNIPIVMCPFFCRSQFTREIIIFQL